VFLEDCLASYPSLHTLIAVHHHCIETESPWMDTMIIENSEAFLAKTKRYPQVKAITSGHIHQVMDMTTGSIRVLGTPSTCFQFTPKSNAFSLDTSAPGYRSIKLYADGKIETEITRLSEPLSGLQIDNQGH
jgi:Icc protein